MKDWEYKVGSPPDAGFYDRVNNMLSGISIDKRSLQQIVASKYLPAGKDILDVIKIRDERSLIPFIVNSLYSATGFCADENNQLFVNDERRRYTECSEGDVTKWICGIFGISDRNDRAFIAETVPEIVKQLIYWCKHDKRELTERTLRDNWSIVNFSNGLYDVLSTEPRQRNGFVIKTSCVNSNYIAKEARGDNDGGMREFAANCSDDITGQKRLLQAIAYAISDYRDNNRLFVLESDSNQLSRIIDSLLKKVLERGQIRYVPLNSLADNMNLNDVKVIISKNCNSSYTVDNNDKLYDILSGMAIHYEYTEKRDVIHTEIRNDLVVFHLKKLPTKFIESLTPDNYERISVIKLRSRKDADWEKLEARLLDGIDYGVSYLMDEILPELHGNGFELAESEDSKQLDISAENPMTQVKLFINARCVTGKGYHISKAELHEAFVEFSGVNNRNAFYALVESEGYTSGKKGNIHVFEGIALQ